MARTSTFTRPPALRNTKDALEQLSRPGPNEVLRGDLGLIGTPGVVFAPASGLGLPAVVFGHDWMQPTSRYAELLRHLASWGIVAAAPGSQGSPLPSVSRLSADLRTTLEVCVGVRLGDGDISVDSRRTALAGHGIGASAALLAAAGHPKVAAVVAIAASQTRPSPVEAAKAISVPGLHIVAGNDTVAPAAGHAEQIAEAYAGPHWIRTLPKAGHTDFLSGVHWSDLVLSGGPNTKVRRVTRALVTAFLLKELCGEDRVDDLVDGKVGGTILTAHP
ncbi:dienelactone hydrolase family protein [Pseudonocardia sp. WMMC193]|uniref:dienelactone hydrolase family protein n=1 Tax=Pseudonocardia sp. WMMC193 TaxID=2911965 RepID=UPI001F3313E6|nr:dienelactone hydrolase family protein [Pseudonocardia sp. WMMC193]MCF7553157.1 dienelactone hydrolase family protein [Pseudonocardia sp. WMMC193]